MNIVTMSRWMKVKGILGLDFWQHKNKLKNLEIQSKLSLSFIWPIKIFFVIVIVQQIMDLVVDELLFEHLNRAIIGSDCSLVVKGIVNEKLAIHSFPFETTILWEFSNSGAKNDAGFQKKY
jgi:hypothetical protein